jgi:predicted nuclease of restriction endonuclease-like (RecB) superfamily
VSGFSAQNLWYMRQFYQEHHESLILQPLVGEIGWAHNLVIMGKCKDLLEREFYLRMTRKFGWTKNVLIPQIENQSYEKSLLGQNTLQKLAPLVREIDRAKPIGSFYFTLLLRIRLPTSLILR